MNTYHFTSDPLASCMNSKMTGTLFTCAAQLLSLLIYVLFFIDIVMAIVKNESP